MTNFFAKTKKAFEKEVGEYINEHGSFPHSIFCFFSYKDVSISIQHKITHFKQHGFHKDLLKRSPTKVFVEEIFWMDDRRKTLSLAGKYLKFVNRWDTNSHTYFAQLKENISISEGQKNFHMLEGEQKDIEHQCKESCPDLGRLKPVASWRKFTLVLADGTHFSRINFKDGSDYYHFARAQGEQQEQQFAEALPSSTAFAIAKFLKNSPLYRALLEKDQLTGNELSVKEENQMRMHLAHMEGVLRLWKEEKTPSGFSFSDYNPEDPTPDTRFLVQQIQICVEWTKSHGIDLELEKREAINAEKRKSEDPSAGKSLRFNFG